MLDEHQERRIAQGLRDGKIDAWQALYDTYAERVWRAVARLLGPDAAGVADVVQETMMAAARSAGKFDPLRGTLWSWLWGIAHNQAALYLRKQERRRAGDDQALGWLQGNDPSPPAALVSAELAVLVRAALCALPADYALMLTARYLDGDAVTVIAQRERQTEAAIRSRLARARQAFRDAFGNYE